MNFIIPQHDHKEVDIAPRTMLKAQIQRARNLGFQVKAASELEYYMYKNTYEDAAKRGYRGSCQIPTVIFHSFIIFN